MGIPKFARFLITRYPLILKKLKEENDIPEIDNLYLDVNGVIHKKAHNNSVILMCKGRSEQDIFYDIFSYIDELVHLVKPKKLLMISADGVAPRAKMNQQRSRRFRKTDINPKELEALRKQGLDPEKMFNSDNISAGTEFMFNLSKAFENFINEKMMNDPLWQGLNVIVTGSEVPGEGEHKIVEYIRQYKNSEIYENDIKHCIYGLDADLIMLSLITHEPNISILREEVVGRKSKDSNPRPQIKVRENFEFIYVSILREYLELEFLEIKPKLKFEYNIERIIDDFIFFCFFIGNDFLPNLNTLDIDHGALENIFLYYKEVMPTLDDYITYHGKIDFKKAEKIFACLATHEISTLRKMLEKVETNCQSRIKKQNKRIEDKKKILKVQKVFTKKENFLIDLKGKDQNFINKFKKERVNRKIENFRKRYQQEIISSGKEYKFEEDIKEYLNKQNKIQKKQINLDLLSNSQSEGSISQSESESENINKKLKLKKEMSKDNLENKKDLVFLFDSDEDENQRDKFNKNYSNDNNDNLTRILKEASKLNKYIEDENYCSDVKIEDIEEKDIGTVSEPEVDLKTLNDEYDDGFNKNLAENQDLDKIFQEKLLELYITDVNKAKAFYYKEKLGIDLQTPEGQNEHKNMFKKYLEGLQWVLYYYYRGVQCWRWYYPYHYAPMISDFNNIKQFLDYEIDKTFQKQKPFSPFQSLLFILPKTSRNLFPQCYWNIFEEFPDLFPNTFGIDFNGKKMPWESLVILPFLKEDLVLDYEKKMREKFHPENIKNILESEKEFVISDLDLERNLHGRSYIYKFNLKENKMIIENFEVYKDSVTTNLDSNYMKKNVDYTFPTLKIFNYDYSFDLRKQYMGKNRDQIKKNKILMLKPILNRNLINEEIIKNLITRKTVYVNYPFKQEGIIRGIVCNNNYYYLNEFNKIAQDKWKVTPEVVDLLRKESFKKGIMLNENINVFVDFSAMLKIVRKSDGSLTKIYDDAYSYYAPFELTSLNSQVNHFEKLNQDFLKFAKKFEKIETEFIINDTNINNINNINEDKLSNPTLLLSKIQFGMLGRVTKIIDKNYPNYEKLNEENYSKYYDRQSNFDLEGNDWEVELDQLYNGPLIEVEIKNTYQTSQSIDPNFAMKIFKNSEDEYISMNELAKQLKISTWTLGLITSSIFVVNCTDEDEIEEDAKISELEHWNLGLNLKSRFYSQKLILPGYTRYSEDPNNYGEGNSWEFSKTAVDLIKQYKNKFPYIFENLEKFKSLHSLSNKFFRVYELFTNLEDFPTKLTEVAVWINSLNINLMNFATQNSSFLSINECRKVEEYLESKNKILKENQIAGEFSNLQILNPNYLFQETLPYVPPFMAYECPPIRIGDRVVNIRSNDFVFVPFGLKGTVTAVTKDFVEVMFDSEFFGGSTLNGRFSSRRGAYINPLNLVNLTNKFPVYLRRNKNKYQPWNLVPSSQSYEEYATTYPLENLSKNNYNNKDNNFEESLNLKRNQSDNLSEPLKEDLKLVKHFSSDIEEKRNHPTNLQTISNKTENVKVPKIIKKEKSNYINSNNNNNNINNNRKNDTINQVNSNLQITKNNSTLIINKTLSAVNIQNSCDNSNQNLSQNVNLDISTPNYVPKRIITKDNNKINSAFKTNPENAIVTKDIHIISNEDNDTTNVSEYRTQRIFQNETLKIGQVYYFSYGNEEEINNLEVNKNLIVKRKS